MADAQPVPRLVEIHDDVDVTGGSMNTQTHTQANTQPNAPTDQQLIDFVIRETRLIDQHRFEEWLELFAEDGFYWMPLEWGQTDPRLTTSLMYEDKLLLKIRVERLKGNRTFSQKPKSRCHHVLQTPQVDSRNEAANEYVTWTPMHYVETRLDQQDLYAAWATHTLAVVDGTLRIKLKRVDIVNCDAAFGNIQLFM
jgi:3-phenylpropionate/cinnamic acid dioxygenase small subunit